MRCVRGVLLVALGIMSFAAAPAAACSMMAGYKVPTNLELAVKGETILIGDGFDLHDAEGRFVRRQRRDALGRLHATDPGLFGPRLARRPGLVALVAAALVIPAALLPNPQDLVIAQNRQVREEAAQQAERIDEVAKDLEGKGADANDPRSQLAE